jgi:hypothetical protein
VLNRRIWHFCKSRRCGIVSALTNIEGFSQSGIESDNLTGSRALAEVI